MRFSEMFISYKIGLKSIKSTIPFIKLPFYRKIAVIVTFSFTIISLILFIFKLYIPAIITFSIDIIFMMLFPFIDAKKSNLELMLEKHYAPYSQKRMNMVINLFREYDLDAYNANTLDLLIDEAQIAQIQNDYLLPIRKPFKALATIVIPIIAYVAEKIGDTASQDEMLTAAVMIIIIAILLISLIYSLAPVIKDILYRDYNKYSELIYDLRQLKIFYAKGNFSSCNKIDNHQKKEDKS